MTQLKPLEDSATAPWHVEKYHGAANDFLFLNLSDASLDWQDLGTDWANNAVAWCDRHRSIGADGVVLWKAASATEHGPARTPTNKSVNGTIQRIEAAIWNSDGSFASTCGNALRCLALVLRRRKLWDGQQALGIYYPPQESFYEPAVRDRDSVPFARLIRLVSEDSDQRKMGIFEVSMGTLRFLDIPEAPWHERLRSEINQTLEKWRLTLGHEAWCEELVFVQLANPHLVMRLRGLTASDPLRALAAFLVDEGQRLKNAFAQAPHPQRSKGAPTETISSQPEQMGQVNLGALLERDGSSPDPHILVVHERGAGVTQACGSGCTAAYAVRLSSVHPNVEKTDQKQSGRGEAASNKSDSQVFRMPGGDLTMRRDENGEYIMAGPATFVASIVIG